MQRDYTRKTEAAAQRQRELDAREAEVQNKVKSIQEAVQSELVAARQTRAKYESIVQQWEQGLAVADKQWEQVDWDTLTKQDPFEAQRLWIQYERHKESKRKVAEEAAQLRAEAEAEHKQARAQRQQALAEHIAKKYPQFNHPEQGPKMASAMKKVAAEYGYTEQQMLNTLDPRAFDMWVDATLHRMSQDELKAASAKPDAPKPDASGRIRIVKQAHGPRIRPPAPEVAAKGRAQAAFNKTLSDMDAAALLRARRAAASRRP